MKNYKSQHKLCKYPFNLHKSLLPSLSFFFIFFFLNCERVIDVDLNEAKPAVVIEGNLSFSDASLEVKISKTGSYFGTSQVERVENAKVYLINAAGTRMEAAAFGQGLYKIEDYPVRNETEYSLYVETAGEEYVAKSTLHPPVKIDSLSYEYQQEVRFFDGGYRILLFFSDPPDKENYYRIKVYKNGLLQNDVDDLIVFDDSGLEGKIIQVRLRGQSFSAGDTAKVEFLSIDKNVWRYFTTFREMANTNPGSPAPANPASNFSNGALGYFSAWSGDEREIIIDR